MKIGILEICTKNHYVLVQGWINVLKYLGHEPVLFIDRSVEQLLDIKEDNLVQIIKENDELTKNYLQKVSNHEIDYMIITSLQSHLIDFYLYFNPKYPYALTIHNAKTWFLGNKLDSVKNIMKRLIRYRFRMKASAYLVSSQNMKKFILKNTSPVKKIWIMPFMLFQDEGYIDQTLHNVKKIVYPGIISATRKKYDTFFKLAKHYADIEFVLLGSPSKNKKENSDEVINKINSLNLKNIRYYTSYIDDKEYNKEFQSAQIIFSELVTDFKKEDYKETYGMSKDSGISYLMIKYSLPLFINKEFYNLEELKETTFYFSNIKDIEQYLNMLFDEKIYSEYREKALQQAKLFDIPSVANRIKGIFYEV